MIKRYSKFINEGKISQFIIKKSIKIINGIENLSSWIKGEKNDNINFKDESIEKEYLDTLPRVIDHFIFDSMKMAISKKIKRRIFSSGFSKYIESRSGHNIYDDINTVIDCLNLENIILPEDGIERSDFQSKMSKFTKSIIKIKSIIKKLDDTSLEERKFIEDMTKIMSELPTLKDKSIDKKISKLKKAINYVDDMKKLEIDDHQMDDILDKVSEFGEDSLTEDERIKLMNWSSKKRI